MQLDDIDSPEFRSLRGADVRVYLAILPFFQTGGTAWPKQATLAKITGLDSTAVCRSVTRLEAAGFLTREPFEGDPRRVCYVLRSPPSRRGSADDEP